jgi:hypothetical protein
MRSSEKIGRFGYSRSFWAFETFHVLLWLVSKLPVSDSDSVSLFWIAEVKALVLFSPAHRL